MTLGCLNPVSLLELSSIRIIRLYGEKIENPGDLKLGSKPGAVEKKLFWNERAA